MRASYTINDAIFTQYNRKGAIMASIETMEHLSETPLRYAVRIHTNRAIVAAFALREDAMAYAKEPFYEVYDSYEQILVKQASVGQHHHAPSH